ncbi:DUF4956 domain-containing protein [Patescibacteria group bacterium]|nr:DUF4956 domain-containing protein [Patescibacteria group bacterium]MBU1682865.1 DUF4956 domain-containing protein [Patescibacteria group bacterium]MBU1934721.1 DUF4956 domain-containing protein [Patescibacteria group bacterium]
MEALQQLLQIQDLTGTFSVSDIAVGLALSFILSALIGLLYQKTHKGTSYTQSYVHTLVITCMVVTIIMLIVGSNIARAFTLVGALSIIRFRNAIKETRDVGFIFFTMAIGMATGTKFYLLAVIATAVIGLAILIMNRFDWYARPAISQILKIQLKNNVNFEKLFDDLFVKFTDISDLISVDTVRAGTLTELVYNVQLKKKANKQEFVNGIKMLNDNEAISLLTGYNAVDL